MLLNVACTVACFLLIDAGSVRKEPSFVSSHKPGSVGDSHRDSYTGSSMRKSLGSRVKKPEDVSVGEAVWGGAGKGRNIE